MDVYFEQNIENPKIDARKKKYKILTIVRYVILVATIVVGYLMIMNVGMTPIDNGWTSVAIQGVVGILAIVPFVLSFIFLGKYLNNTNLEFDYVLTGGIFRIIKVINRKKRRKMLEFNLSSIESIGRIQSETYDRYASAKDIKKVFAICNFENEDKIVYIYYGHDGSKQLLHIEPNDDMIMALRRSVSRITVMDKSLKVSAPTNTNAQDKGDKK